MEQRAGASVRINQLAIFEPTFSVVKGTPRRYKRFCLGIQVWARRLEGLGIWVKTVSHQSITNWLEGHCARIQRHLDSAKSERQQDSKERLKADINDRDTI